MAERRKKVESHGCIVCGKLYNLLVVYAPNGKLVDCTVTSPGGHRVADPNRPLVACDTHADSLVEAASARRQSAGQPDEAGEED